MLSIVSRVIQQTMITDAISTAQCIKPSVHRLKGVIIFLPKVTCICDRIKNRQSREPVPLYLSNNRPEIFVPVRRVSVLDVEAGVGDSLYDGRFLDLALHTGSAAGEVDAYVAYAGE